MTERDQWTAVDNYFSDRLIGNDEVLDSALRASDEAGLPRIAVSPLQGKLLMLLARTQGAKKILEIGTLGGYSTIWMARALPSGGKVITLEADPKHAEVARENIARAGVAEVVDIRLGKALDTLPEIESEGLGPFDFFFIDADKPSNPDYLAWALKLSRPGSIIIADNVVRGGSVIDSNGQDAGLLGIRRFTEMLANEPRLTATALQTVGIKGYDGFAMAVVS